MANIRRFSDVVAYAMFVNSGYFFSMIPVS